jgi:phenylacetate-CoA ligase
MNDEALRRMREIACFAYEHSPYYKKLYDTKGINPELVEIPSGLPIIAHTELVKSSLLFRSNIPVYKVCASSGTKDNPKLMFRSEEDFEKSVYNQVELMKWSGVKSGDIVAIAQPFGIWGYGDLTQEASKRMGALALPIGNISDETALELIMSLKATVLDISPSRLRKLLQLLKAAPVAEHLCLKSIMCAGEPVTAGLRNHVLNTLGTKLYDQYGSEETDGLGGNQTYGSGISLFYNDFIFEVLDDDGKHVKDNEAGTLVVTSLYHKGTPLIRYELQDIIKRHSKIPEEVEVLGRKCDYAIIYDSVKLYPYHIEEILRDVIKDVTGWQCIIEQMANQLQLTVNIDSPDLSRNDLNKIENLLPKCSIDIEALVRNESIVFKVKLTPDGIISTNRGKCLRFIDMRTN